MVFDRYEEAYQTAVEYMRFYNERRIHSSILDLPPHLQKSANGSVNN